jgi:hypothetical protein
MEGGHTRATPGGVPGDALTLNQQARPNYSVLCHENSTSSHYSMANLNVLKGCHKDRPAEDLICQGCQLQAYLRSWESCAQLGTLYFQQLFFVSEQPVTVPGKMPGS